MEGKKSKAVVGVVLEWILFGALVGCTIFVHWNSYYSSPDISPDMGINATQTLRNILTDDEYYLELLKIGGIFLISLLLGILVTTGVFGIGVQPIRLCTIWLFLDSIFIIGAGGRVYYKSTTPKNGATSYWNFAELIFVALKIVGFFLILEFTLALRESAIRMTNSNSTPTFSSTNSRPNVLVKRGTRKISMTPSLPSTAEFNS